MVSAEKIKISAVIITRNAERCLEAVLASLDFCDEIVVVDSGSSDATEEICKHHNCRIFKRTFDGFGTQKQFAVLQAKNEWVLSVDADEVLSLELKKEIVKLFKTSEIKYDGFYIPRSLVFLGRVLHFSGEYKKPILRLFRKGAGGFNRNTVHEGIVVNGKIGTLRNHMLHYSYATISDYFERFNQYSSIAALDCVKKKKKIVGLKVWTRFPLTFFKIYFLKLSILDGYAGFLWALFSALHVVVKYAKTKELRDNDGAKSRL
jgi:glycosyltransferase involved in cell wall biosynthesis